MLSPEIEAKLAELDAQEVPGWFTPAEGRACVERIMGLSEPFPRGMEIGAFCGRSTRYVALAMQARKGKWHTVDHFQGSIEHRPLPFRLRPVFEEMLTQAGLRDEVTLWHGSSAEAWECMPAWYREQKPLSFLLVDGSHDTDSCYFDLSHWGALVPPGGIVAVHDRTFNTVRRAMENFFDEFHWLTLPPVDNLAFLRRVAA